MLLKNKSFNYIISIIVIFSFFSTFKLRANDAFYAKNHLIHDLTFNLLWLRCSVGQVWNSESKQCQGKALKLKIS